MALAEQQALKATKKIIAELKMRYERSVKKQTGFMLKLNEKQLDQGKKNNDNPITPFYTDAYAKKKKRNIPDLKDTGDFRDSFYIDVNQSGLNYWATDEKTTFLAEKYTTDIFGLTEDNAIIAFGRVFKPVNKFVNGTVSKYL